jgi:hypothetical protein
MDAAGGAGAAVATGSARCVLYGMLRLAVPPQEGSTDCQQNGDHHQLRAADAPLSACAVVPRDYDDHGDTQDQQQREETQQAMCPTQRAAEHLGTVQQCIGERQVGERPLHDLVTFDPLPNGANRRNRRRRCASHCWSRTGRGAWCAVVCPSERRLSRGRHARRLPPSLSFDRFFRHSLPPVDLTSCGQNAPETSG